MESFKKRLRSLKDWQAHSILFGCLGLVTYGARRNDKTGLLLSTVGGTPLVAIITIATQDPDGLALWYTSTYYAVGVWIWFITLEAVPYALHSR